MKSKVQIYDRFQVTWLLNCDTPTKITTCAICLETFDNPRYLPCLHTFCENCLATYISAALEKGDKIEVSCPVCRTTTSAPSENCSPQDWVKTLPLNCLVVGIMEQQKLERAEKQCMSCERIEKSSMASFVCVECGDALCENCHQCHKPIKLLLDIKLFLFQTFLTLKIFEFLPQ